MSGCGGAMERGSGSGAEAQRAGPPEAEVGPGPSSSSLVSATGTNGKAVVCERCGSRVLGPGTARYRRRELFLPSMRQRVALGTEESSVKGDMLQEHWFVDDMYTFENVGFTKNVNNIKYLVCADCEIGPIGWHCLDDKKSFYVALDRVQHE
ncbi:guanine nucleotide exchange factor MSS4 [Carcharodon carcharias]|uniref:guanine nucleotide exchange factor MSS4 n=1 Tax=Carcharodon carcharias TaxID=13397 RepID=UPI001B7E64AE|nr:guanine nucleotide exchange factor MSS4 [Carcharodon carcharias]